MKKGIVVALAMLFLSAIPASADAQPVFRIESGEVACGETVEIPISLTGSGSVASFTLDIQYDSMALQPVRVTGTQLLAGQITSNLRYRDNALRIVYASDRNIGATGEVLTLTMRANANQRGGTTVALNGSIGYIGNQELESISGTVEQGSVRISLNPSYDASAERTIQVSGATTTGRAEVELSVSAQSALDACSGSFTVSYDDALDVVQCEKGSLLKDMIVMVNPESGKKQIKVNFMGTTPLSGAGELLRIRLQPRSEAAGTYQVSVREAFFYQLDEMPIPVRLLAGTVEIKEQGRGSAAQTAEVSPGTAGTEPEKDAAPQQAAWENPFSDISPLEWYYDNVRFVMENGLMKGVSDTEFSPNRALTRAALVTVLYRNEKEPETEGTTPFADVKLDAYYAEAVAWACKNGIIHGVSETQFSPDESITREQIAAIMYRYAQYKSYDVSAAEQADLADYRDAGGISDYAKDSMQYMVASGLIRGTSADTLSPLNHATRAEIAAILQRFIEANA